MKYSVIQLSSVSRDKQRKIAMKGAKFMAAIGGAVAEEYYGWTGFYNEDELLKKYLDANLYNLVKL